MSFLSLPIATNSSLNTEVQVVAEAFTGFPVEGFITPVAWNFSASSSSAGAYPLPFSVIT